MRSLVGVGLFVPKGSTPTNEENMMGACGFHGTFAPPFRFGTIRGALPEALAFLGKRDSRKLGHKTYLRRTDTGVAVRLYETDVMRVDAEKIVLDTGGWKTMRSKERLNELLPPGVCVYSGTGVWYLAVRSDGKDDRFGYDKTNRRDYAFADGIAIHTNGRVTGAANVAKLEKLKERVTAFATEFARQAVAGHVPAPGAGDCWICCLDRTGKGEALRSEQSHMLDHLGEHYFVPTLLANAAKETDNFFLLRHGLGVLWASHLTEVDRKKMLDYDGRRIETEIRRAIRKYVGKRLGLAVR